MSKWYSFEELKRARTPMPLDSETGLPDNHVITVVERVISVDDSELIQNNVRTDTFTLNLDAEYDDLNVVVIFTKPNNINVKVAYNGTPTHIPGSAMELVGSLACSVVGIDADGEVRAVTKAAPDTFQVVKSGAYDGSVTSDDAELLGQILQAVSDAEAAITEAETATTAATNATSQATSAATSANQAASSANTAASSANSAATKANSAAVDAQNAYDTLQPYMATIDSCANILHREVGPDTVVTADDSFPCKPVEMTVYGNTVQNLWVNPSGTLNGVTITANDNGSLTLSGTASAGLSMHVQNVYTLKPNTQYTITLNRVIQSGVLIGVNQRRADGSQAEFSPIISGTSDTFTTSSEMSSCWMTVVIDSGTTVSDTYRVMLNEGSEAQPWCPPGLNSVGQLREDEKNLWVNPNFTMNGVTCSGNEDGSFTISGTSTNSNFSAQLEAISLKPGRRYIISIDNLPNFGVSIQSSADGSSYQTIGHINANTDVAIRLNTPSSAKYFRCGIQVIEGTTVSGTYRVMLNEGSTAQPWVPPESESCVQVVTAGKNLAIVSNFVISASKEVRVSTSIKKGTYTISFAGGTPDSVGSKLRIRYYDASGSGLKYIGSIPDSGKTYTFEYDVSYVYAYANTDFEGESNISNFQLELGSTATDYEPPNITTTTPIDLQGHTLNALPDGTRDELHIDGGGNVVLEKRTHKSVVDGDLNWGGKNSIGQFISSNAVEYAAPISGNDYINTFIDKLIPSSELQNSLCISNISGRDLYLRDPVFASDNSEVKSWFASNPTTIIYKLAEPQTIDLGTITPPTMAAPNVTAYVADDTPAEMELDYVRDINIVVDRLEKKVADLVVTEATIV